MSEEYSAISSGSVIQLELSTLAADPGYFRMSFGFDLKPLVDSIDAAGLLNVPVVWEQNGRVHVVSGYRRVLALREIGTQKVECRTIPSSTSKARCMLLNFHDNLATRPLNQVEKAMTCSRLASLIPQREVIDRYMPALGLSSNDKTLKLYLAIDAEPDGEIKQALASGQISLRASGELLNLDASTKKAFCNLFSRIKFNNNQQIQVIDIMNDISNATGAPPSMFMQEKELKAIVYSETMNQPQKARAVLDYCRRRRCPRLHAAENRFKSQVGRLGLPRGVSIMHPEFFEASEFRMELKFKDGIHLKHLLGRLNSLPLENLVSPWKEDVIDRT